MVPIPKYALDCRPNLPTRDLLHAPQFENVKSDVLKSKKGNLLKIDENTCDHIQIDESCCFFIVFRVYVESKYAHEAGMVGVSTMDLAGQKCPPGCPGLVGVVLAH